MRIAHIETAAFHYKAERFSDAARECQAAIDLDSTNPVAHTLYGRVLLSQRRYRDALNCFNAALDHDPAFVQALALRGNTRRLMRDNKAALADFSAAINVLRENPDAGVVPFLEEVLTLDRFYRERGALYLVLKESDKALADLNEAISLMPTSDNFNSRAIIFREMGLLNQALDDYSKAIEASEAPKPVFFENRASLLAQQGLYCEALNDLKKAIDLAAGATSAKRALYARGRLLLHLERTREAVADFEKAIEVDPQFALVRGEIERVLCRVKRPSDMSELHYAAALALEVGYFGLLRELVVSRACVNEANADGDTPLHLAARQKQTDVVTFLLKAKADATVRNSSGQDVYEAARIANSDSNTILELLENHAGQIAAELVEADELDRRREDKTQTTGKKRRTPKRRKLKGKTGTVVCVDEDVQSKLVDSAEEEEGDDEEKQGLVKDSTTSSVSSEYTSTTSGEDVFAHHPVVQANQRARRQAECLSAPSKLVLGRSFDSAHHHAKPTSAQPKNSQLAFRGPRRPSYNKPKSDEGSERMARAAAMATASHARRNSGGQRWSGGDRKSPRSSRRSPITGTRSRLQGRPPSFENPVADPKAYPTVTSDRRWAQVAASSGKPGSLRARLAARSKGRSSFSEPSLRPGSLPDRTPVNLSEPIPPPVTRSSGDIKPPHVSPVDSQRSLDAGDNNGSPGKLALALPLPGGDGSPSLKHTRTLNRPRVPARPTHTPRGGGSSEGTSSGDNNDGGETGDDDAVAVGKIVYYRNRVLGHGSQGAIVYSGLYDRRPAAIKRIQRDGVNHVAEEETMLIALSSTEVHKNIVRYYGKEEDTHFVYLAMERAETTVFREYIGVGDERCKRWARCRSLKCREQRARAMSVLREVVAGVAFLHRENIVHNDLKPRNILLTRMGTVKISDVGLGRLLSNCDSSFTFGGSGRPGGDGGWYAPEVLLEKSRKTMKVDIFSLGILFFFVLTGGAHPFGEVHLRNANILSGTMDLSQLRDPEGEALVSEMLCENPDERPSASDILRHPFLWKDSSRLDYLHHVSNFADQPPSVERGEAHTALVAALDTHAAAIVEGSDGWRSRVTPAILHHQERYRKYNGKLVGDLLRSVRNLDEHFFNIPESVHRALYEGECAEEEACQGEEGSIPFQEWREDIRLSKERKCEVILHYYLSKFPGLLMMVFKADVASGLCLFSQYGVAD